MAKQLIQLQEVVLKPGKNGIDLRVLGGTAVFRDKEGYTKVLKKQVWIKNMTAQQQAALLQVWKFVKNALENVAGTTPVDDPVVDTSEVQSPL